MDIGTAAQPILGGRLAEDCEWPSVVSLDVCSGVLVSPYLVVYAAHCGNGIEEARFGSNDASPDFVVPTDRCGVMPGAGLGDGTDLAYCVLAEPVTEVEPARVMAGCELDGLVEGAEVTMVGFGKDGPSGKTGTKRVGTSVIAEVGPDLLLDSENVDTCFGDSGGPLFLSLEQSDGTVVQRLVGITSAGSESECGSGVSHYANLTRQLEWLETASGVDATPCFDGEDWAPTPRCISLVGMEPDGGDESGEGGGGACRLAADPKPLSTCGAPFAVDSEDEEAPSLELGSPLDENIQHVLASDESYVEFEVRANAKDHGWGVEEVRFLLLGDDGEVKVERVDQVAPYGIPLLRVPEGSFTLVTEATDYAGNTTVEKVSIDVTGEEANLPQATSSCQLTRRSTSAAPFLAFLLPVFLRRAFGGTMKGRRAGRTQGQRLRPAAED